MSIFTRIQADFKRVLIFYISIIFILILFLTLFNVPAFEDFYYYYAIDGIHIAQGHLLFRDFIPFYPIVMEYYLGLLGLMSMNVLIARCIQAGINIVIFLIMYDICKVLGIQNSNKIMFFYSLNTIMIFFSIVQVNNDILLVLLIALSLNFYLRKNYVGVGITVALGLLTKLFAIVILIPVGLFLIKRKEIKNIILLVISFLATFLALILPFYFLSNVSIFDIILNPFRMTEGHPLNQPYYLIHGFGVAKQILQYASSFTAIGIIIFYVLYIERKEEDLSINTIFWSFTLFLLFQSFLVPWFFVWIMPIYHLVQKDNIEKKIWLVQIFIGINFLMYSLPGYFIVLGQIPLISSIENFFITFSIYGSILFGLGVLILQFSVLLLLTNDKTDLPKNELFISNIVLNILAAIFLILTLIF
ncbi:MAG: hypothetical protein EAX96_18025 [Candidatus Lokiarchaeota archaeon]|nr:hypothetical protein [Candidatus Lokiarchaeota archaeon]